MMAAGSKHTHDRENRSDITHNTIQHKCEINEILHSIWTMEDNIHASCIALLRKGLLKILCRREVAEIF